MANSSLGIAALTQEVGAALREDQDPLTAVVRALEEDIVFGRRHQRERLIEDDLMTRFQAKRHIIRSALAELERMGLVERFPNRGSSVRAFDPETVNNLYVVRELLEAKAAKLIPLPLSSDALRDVKEIQQIHDGAVKARDLPLAFRSNIEFHRRLFALCGNPVLADAINDFAYRTHGIRFYSLNNPVYLKRSNDEHHKMIKALKSGDREELVELCRKHLLPAKNLYLETALHHASR